MSAETARTDRDGVAELRLDRSARRNALTVAVLTELREHLEAISKDPAVRAVVLTGAGADFCAGADVDEFGPGAPPAGPQRRIRLVADVLSRLGALEQPTVAAVQGNAVGAGWGLALACDLCFAARDAAFRLPEVAKGFRIPEVLMRRLVQVVGPVRAAELAFAGTPWSAQDAHAAGAVTRVLADAEAARAEAHALCADLAARPPRSVASAKAPLRALAPRVVVPAELTWIEE